MTLNTLIHIAVLFMFCSCHGQGQKNNNSEAEMLGNELKGDTVAEIDGEIRGIYQDSKGNLWFASNGNGVYKYDGHAVVNFTEKHGLASDYVWMVGESKDGNIWFKTNIRAKDIVAICRFNGHEFEVVESDTNAVNPDFEKGDLLFDYYFNGKVLSKMKLPQNSPIKNEENKRHHYDIYASFLDRSGNAWFGTCTAGICKYDGKNYTWFDNLELGSAVRDIYQDKNGTLWAGNNGDGLFWYDGSGFVNFSREKNLHNPDFGKYPNGKPGLLSRVWKIAEDDRGNLWVATIDNGVWVYDGDKIMNYTIKDGLGIDNVWTIYKDQKGTLWLGTEGDGVYTFNGKTFDKFKP